MSVKALLVQEIHSHLGPDPLLYSSVELADRINAMPEAEAVACLAYLPMGLSVAICDLPDLERRSLLIEKLPPALAAQILEGMSADERAAVVEDMSEYGRRRLMPLLESELSREVEMLLRYPDRSAGSIMTTELVRLSPTMDVESALRHIREVADQKETVYDSYVLDADGRLLGVVSLRDLIRAHPERPVADVMTRRVKSVETHDHQEVVAELISKYNLLALPVLDEGRLVGLVTVDDVIDVLIQENTDDFLRMAAVQPDPEERSYFAHPVLEVVKARVGWLLLLFLAETLTGTVLRHYEAQLAQVVALSFFVPLLIGTGGNAGAQTVTTVVRSLALGEVQQRDTLRVLGREAVIGLLVGLTIAGVALVRAMLWGSSLALSATVACTVLVICLWATSVGALIPLMARRLGLDPAILSAPLITTLVDATGLVLYFQIARLLLHI